MIDTKINKHLYKEIMVKNILRKKTKSLIILTVLLLSANSFAQNTILNVKDFGAKGDGKTMDTEAIQSTIDKCFMMGGGEVFLPTGKYLVGCIILKSNINLNISSKAVLLGSTNKDDYQIIVPNYESRTNNLYVNRSIIYAENADNISVTGEGIIDGQGTDKAFSITRPQINRPFLARFTNCSKLIIKDITMLESANWTCYLLGCKGVIIDNLKIRNTVRANRDGLDIDCCENVEVSNSRINSMDDAIVLKSTGPAITRNINITNCSVSSHASGIKFGTETTGGYENITISNCEIRNIPTYSGLSMMIVDGGIMKNISINNIVMDSVNIPFMIRLGNRARPYKAGIPIPESGSIENITISNVVVTNAGQTSHITGLLKKKIKNISFKNINVQYRNKYERKPLAYNRVPLKETMYPSGQLYGNNLPASAFYFRDIDGITIDKLIISIPKKDSRVAVVFDRVDRLQCSNSHSKTFSPTPFFYLRNSNNCYFNNCSNYGHSKYLAITEEESCKDIFIQTEKYNSHQKSIQIVPALSNKTYDEISGYSSYKFPGNEIIKDVECVRIQDSVSFQLKSKPETLSKILFLGYSEKPNNVLSVSVNGKKYMLKVSGETWGWSTIRTMKISKSAKMNIVINNIDESSPVWVSKIVLQDVKKTD